MQKPAASGPLVGVALIVGSCLSLPFGAAVAAQLFPVLGPWGVTSLRVAIAALLLVVIVRPRPGRWNRSQWLAATLFGVSLAVMNGFFYAAIDRIPLGPAVAIEFLGPLVLAAVLTRKLADAAWVGVALVGMALLGIDGMIGADPLDPLGVLFILIAAGFWVMYIRMSARVGRLIPGNSGLAMGLVVAAVLSSVIPYSFELAALRRLPQRVFGVLLSLEPAFATLAGWLILGQDATVLRMLAVVLVIAASVGTTLGVRRDRRGDGGTGPFTAPIPLPD